MAESDELFAHLIVNPSDENDQNDQNGWDKACQVRNNRAQRTTCNIFGNGALVEAEADKTFVVEEFGVNNCDSIQG